MDHCTELLLILGRAGCMQQCRTTPPHKGLAMAATTFYTSVGVHVGTQAHEASMACHAEMETGNGMKLTFGCGAAVPSKSISFYVIYTPPPDMLLGAVVYVRREVGATGWWLVLSELCNLQWAPLSLTLRKPAKHLISFDVSMQAQVVMRPTCLRTREFGSLYGFYGVAYHRAKAIRLCDPPRCEMLQRFIQLGSMLRILTASSRSHLRGLAPS